MMEPPKAPAGWYPDTSTSGQTRYWDGERWTEHTAPVDAPPVTAEPQASAAPSPAVTHACPYCKEPIASNASRCSKCGGELRNCPRCKRYVGTRSKQKFVGMARGGMKTQYRCMNCDRVLDGPRF